MIVEMSSARASHDDVWILLPWYVNQTLSDEQQEMVEGHLKVCGTCRRALECRCRLLERVRNSSITELDEYVQFASLAEKIRKKQHRQGVSEANGRLPASVAANPDKRVANYQENDNFMIH